MTLKKLAAGSGYEYLTRQVAAADSTELGRTRLVDYYEAKGEAPGRWVGSGLIGIDGIEYGDVVTAGVDAALMKRWSSRRANIEDCVAELTGEFTKQHRRPPTEKESIALAQRANLETRQAKHEPRSETDQRSTWHSQAADLLGERGLRVMVDTALNHDQPPRTQITSAWLASTADEVITELESHRATWQSWHMHAEAQRQVRDLDLAPG